MWLALVVLVLAACSAPAHSWIAPPATVQLQDLAGVWKAHYGEISTDQFVLYADGMFCQTYRDTRGPRYDWEMPQWGQAWLERLADGHLRLHLPGARFYKDGTSIAERQGMTGPHPEIPGYTSRPWTFYDPFDTSYLLMVDELVLAVRQDEVRQELLLHHMWTSSDRGFALIGGEMEVFRRVAEFEPETLTVRLEQAAAENE